MGNRIFKTETILKTKTRILTLSKLFKNWSRKIHKQNLITKIDQNDQQSVRDQLRSEDDEQLLEPVIHDI